MNVSGFGLPGSPRSLATTPSTRASISGVRPVTLRTSSVLAEEETTARRSPASRAASR